MKNKLSLKIKLLKILEKYRIREDQIYFVLTLFTGLATGIVAVVIHKLSHFLAISIGSDRPFELKTFLWGGLFVFISGLITTRYAPNTSGSGIPFIRVWLVAKNGAIQISFLISKFVTSVLSLSSGLSIGREGPTVAISAAIGSFFANTFSLSKYKMKGLVAIGSAGGLAAAFNTPMAAVVFTLEEVVGDLNAKFLGSIVISSVIASYITSLLRGDHSTFVTAPYEIHSFSEYFVYLLIGVICGFLGPLWVKSVINLKQTSKKIFKHHKLTIIMVSFFFIGFLSLINQEILGSGHLVINKVFSSKISGPGMLLSLLLLKFIATAVCYSSGVSGGLFIPTLFIGAMVGGFVSSVFQFFSPELIHQIGPFALVGMGAFFVSVIRAPFTSFIMIFELTQNYSVILPLMISNITAYLIARKFYHKSIYEALSEEEGMHLPTREDDEILDNLHVEDAMIKDVAYLTSDTKVKEALSIIKNKNITGYPIVENKKLVGIISINEIGLALSKGLGDKNLKDICTKDLVTVYPDQSLLVAFHKLKKFNVSRIPVVSRLDHHLILGIITAQDIVAHFGYNFKVDEEKNSTDEESTPAPLPKPTL